MQRGGTGGGGGGGALSKQSGSPEASFSGRSMPQAARRFGQPRPVSRLAALQASFHTAVRLGGLVELLLFGLRAAGKRVQHPVGSSCGNSARQQNAVSTTEAFLQVPPR